MTTIYTDGACARNPGGRGGWAAIVIEDGAEPREFGGSAPSTTNNRMELQAAIEGLKATRGDVRVVSDSQYLVNGASKWIQNWRKRGWLKVGSTAIANPDLWLELESLMTDRHVEWEWVRGHAGNPFNERCDEIANRKAGIDERFTPAWGKPRRRHAS